MSLVIPPLARGVPRSESSESSSFIPPSRVGYAVYKMMESRATSTKILNKALRYIEVQDQENLWVEDL